MFTTSVRRSSNMDTYSKTNRKVYIGSVTKSDFSVTQPDQVLIRCFRHSCTELWKSRDMGPLSKSLYDMDIAIIIIKLKSYVKIHTKKTLDSYLPFFYFKIRAYPRRISYIQYSYIHYTFLHKITFVSLSAKDISQYALLILISNIFIM